MLSLCINKAKSDRDHHARWERKSDRVRSPPARRAACWESENDLERERVSLTLSLTLTNDLKII